MEDRVRVIILDYNNPEITVECARVSLRQSYTPVDIVVVDNGSTENNYVRLKELLPQEVTLVRSEHNIGYAAGNNLGARWSGLLPEPDYFLILNNDAFFRDVRAISKFLHALKCNQGRVAVSPLVNHVGIGRDPNTQIQVRRDAGYGACLVAGSWWLRRLPLLKKIHDWHVYADQRPYELNREYACDSINGSCFMVKADFLKDIGFFDEGTFLYFEEMVLGRQVRLMGKSCCLLTSVVVDHHQGISSGQRGSQVKFGMYKEYVKSQIYYCKNYLRVGRFRIGLLVLVRFADFATKSLYQRMLKNPGRQD